MTAIVSAPTCAPPTLLIESAKGRDAFVGWALRRVKPGFVLVKTQDLYARRRAFRTEVLSPRAQLVAREAPLILRGGVSQLTAYWLVPEDELQGREIHLENGHESHRYDVTLPALRPSYAKHQTS